MWIETWTLRKTDMITLKAEQKITQKSVTRKQIEIIEYCKLYYRGPPRALLPYLGEEVCAPQWHGELCGRERKLLVGPGQTKYSPWSSRLGVRCESNDPTPEKFPVTKPWRRPTHRVVEPAKEREKKTIMMIILKETEIDGISLRKYGRYLTSQEIGLLYDQKYV